MRIAYDWRSGSINNFYDFCKKHPEIDMEYKEWTKIIYDFNSMFTAHILETGEKIKLPFGIGEFSIIKRKKKKVKVINGKEKIGLSVDWKKTREKGKLIYNFNFHTEGYSFRWIWFKNSARFKYSDFFYFKAARPVSRMLSNHLFEDPENQHKYASWT